MSDGVRDVRTVEDFVRNELGCGCPPEVFDDIRFADPATVGEIEGAAWLIDIGSRLLVMILDPGASVLSPAAIARLLQSAAEFRDRHRFNRCRLVLVEHPSLTPAVAEVATPDDRAHLHIVARDRLPYLPAQ